MLGTSSGDEIPEDILYSSALLEHYLEHNPTFEVGWHTAATHSRA